MEFMKPNIQEPRVWNPEVFFQQNSTAAITPYWQKTALQERN